MGRGRSGGGRTVAPMGAGPTQAGTYRVFHTKAMTDEQIAQRERPWYGFGEMPYTRRSLKRTHVPIGTLEANRAEDVFRQLNDWRDGDRARYANWASRAQSAGSGHTSLSVGDIIQAPDRSYYVVADRGWIPLR
jgi:hypothetical protein